MSEHNFERLKEHILPLSNANHFDAARREWKLTRVEISEEFDYCPCGHGIKEHCFIRNDLNGNTTYVGNVCIKRFIGIDTGNLFAGLRRIVQDPQANANEDLIIHAYRFGYIYDGEYKFLELVSKLTDFKLAPCKNLCTLGYQKRETDGQEGTVCHG